MLPLMMNISPGNARPRRHYRNHGIRVSSGTLLLLVAFGMFVGYIIGLAIK